MARADIGEMFWAATRPGVCKIFGSMDLQPCWVDTGDPHADIKLTKAQRPLVHNKEPTYTLRRLRSLLHALQGPQPLQYLRETRQSTGVQALKTDRRHMGAFDTASFRLMSTALTRSAMMMEKGTMM